MADGPQFPQCGACGTLARAVGARFCLSCGVALVTAHAGDDAPCASNTERLRASESVDTDYNFRFHLKQLGRDYLERSDQRRLRQAMDVCADEELLDQEVLVVLSDALLESEFGLLVVTDERVLFIGEDADRASVSIVHEEITAVIPTAVGSDGDLSDLIVVTKSARYRFECVGPDDWVEDLAACIEGAEEGEESIDPSDDAGLGGAMRPFENDDEAKYGCLQCGAAYVSLVPGAECMDCGGELVDRNGRPVPAGSGDSEYAQTIWESTFDPDVLPGPTYTLGSGASLLPSSGGAGLVDALERLAALHRQGVLSEIEFNAAKARLLSG